MHLTMYLLLFVIDINDPAVYDWMIMPYTKHTDIGDEEVHDDPFRTHMAEIRQMQRSNERVIAKVLHVQRFVELGSESFMCVCVIISGCVSMAGSSPNPSYHTCIIITIVNNT